MSKKEMTFGKLIDSQIVQSVTAQSKISTDKLPAFIEEQMEELDDLK